MKVKLRYHYEGSKVHQDKEVKLRRSHQFEPILDAVDISIANGSGNVIVSERGIIVVSARGVEHDIKFQS